VVRAAVVPVQDDLRGEEVKDHVQLTEGLGPADTTPERIFAHCRISLASFKIPRYLSYVDAFPLNDSGRVLKSAPTDGAGGGMRKDSFDRIDGLSR
jgi:acyl-coenzyme A synthetase/AMP-(fatty) acid ligase